MNYAMHYERLIERSRGRSIDGYRERHHIVPRCMGGGNEPGNLVDLTAEEHYVAHQLLVKIHPTESGLVLAAVRMAKQCTGNKAYAWLRKKSAGAQRARMAIPENREKLSLASKAWVWTPEQRQKQRDAMAAKRGLPTSDKHRAAMARPEHLAMLSARQLGKTLSPQARAKVSKASLGNKYNVGRKQTAETIERRAAKLRGRRNSDEVRQRMSTAQKGRTVSQEHRDKIAATLRGRTQSLETRLKRIATLRANPHRLGVEVPQSVRDKISASLRGKTQSAETIAKRVASIRVTRALKAGAQVSQENRS